MSTTSNTNNVCALTKTTGMEPSAYLSQIAAVGRNGMKRLLSVIALKILTGMEEVVCYAQLENSGTPPPILAYVLQEPSGTTNSVL